MVLRETSGKNEQLLFNKAIRQEFEGTFKDPNFLKTEKRLAWQKVQIGLLSISCCY